MGEIRKENLHQSLIEHLNSLGLTEDQVNNIVQEALANVNAKDLSQDEAMGIIQSAVNKAQGEVDAVELEVDALQEFVNGHSHATIEQNITNLQNAVNSKADQSVVSNIGTLSNLLTSEKSSLVGATNEIFDMLCSMATKLSNVKQIACGNGQTFILKNDGSLWACGANSDGQLGLGDTTARYTFTQVTTNINNDVKQIACGVFHTFILKNDGSVWSCGNNGYGQLGLGDTTKRTTFTQVTTNINNDVKYIACGQYHTFILKNDGSVWSCGDNYYGQLGLNDTTDTDRKIFTKVTNNINNDATQIVCGQYHAFILKNDGSVWGCGKNNSGQLGLGNTTTQITFTKVTTNINNDVKQIACGYNHTYILKNDGSIWVCGLNTDGELGFGDTTNRNTFTQVTTNINNDVKQIVGGQYHTIILKNDGSVWSCGSNGSGELGLGNTTDRNTFTKVTTNINNDVKQIACGGYHTFILKNDGSLCGCGYNSNVQLGLNDYNNRTTFTQVNPFTIF